MQQKYIYSYNAIANWFKGIVPFYSKNQKIVVPYHQKDQVYVWRNKYMDGYKIGETYQDKPLDLSNYLLIRTRERLLLENKVKSPVNVMKSAKTSKWFNDVAGKSLSKVNEDLKQTIPYLHRMLYITGTKEFDFPVAFASNALYVLERNGAGNREDYEKILIPIIKNKIDYLHGEGVAQTVWALANAEIWDTQLWDQLKNHIENKDYNYIVVQNQRWSTGYFITQAGNEHFYQSELSQFAQNVFFQDQLNLFELYNGLIKAHSSNKNLGLENTIKNLEIKYKDVLGRNNDFKELEKTLQEENLKISQNSGNKALHV